MSHFSEAQVRILGVAWELVTERGGVEFTTAELADAVGISRQAVYQHFHDRVTLLDAMLGWSQAVSQRPEPRRRMTVSEVFESLLRRWLDTVRPAFPVAYALEVARSGEPADDFWGDWVSYWHGELRHHVGLLATQHGLAAGWDAAEAAEWIWARTGPAVWQYLVGECGWPPARCSGRLMSSVMGELVAPGASTRTFVRPGGARRRARQSTKAKVDPASEDSSR